MAPLHDIQADTCINQVWNSYFQKYTSVSLFTAFHRRFLKNSVAEKLEYQDSQATLPNASNGIHKALITRMIFTYQQTYHTLAEISCIGKQCIQPPNDLERLLY